ncbi:MAG: TauD/TfdA family dioxygenase [Alphaproteobacteria bacterium]|jgi:hypothetical protein|nr:hypothetical protein [Rhodospirillaceae bacterium]MBT6203998.1 hypothetical protein [Rhodospirillaceae bacterium]MBT6511280.1 hypothetical protein [Rhodospirillaceae bacterium]MBT7612663.1 hypothetical protein [Rhodospirillaceae bacterium]MDG2480882.1 TauD/TfdA family dioxygenase [Alphaproteobacteria bacterium]
MKIPRVTMAPELLERVATHPGVFRKIASRLVATLRRHPHCLVLVSPEPTEDWGFVHRLMQSIAINSSDDEEPQLPKVSFTRVRIDPEKLAQKKDVTHYSRTNRSLELHTDVSYKQQPEDVVAFQMVRADPQGGESLVAAVEDVVHYLDRDTIEALRQPVFPFGRGNHRVLSFRKGFPHIRYYRAQIDSACENGPALEGQSKAAMDRLDEVLQRDDVVTRFRVESGETLFLHNTKTLHGRLGFSEQSDRLMYRFRVGVPDLD